MNLLFVAIGSALGGVARFLLGGAIQSRAGAAFPFGTLVVNVSGAFLIGVIARYALETQQLSPAARLFLMVGICGGYTTFSTFSIETIQLLEQGDYVRAASYVAGSVVLSLAATSTGIAAARALTQ